MILIGLGGNMPTPEYGRPEATLEAALAALAPAGARVTRRSRWYRTAPVPPSDQPPFVNGVAALETELGPVALLELLHATERRFGRVRTHRWAPRTIDLDLLAYDDLVRPPDHPGGAPELPHPRLSERAFVLVPLEEIAPAWRHPVSGLGVGELLARLGGDRGVDPL